ncbi:acetyl-CoA synthetase-like protein [Glonium stellatum]|uniref:Acetyl-CoA synthetase-like protein n=1 Tax=Glonium stellatum TaxID=574774 RepID=A0A8E2JP27_9PEZI|nr:acetyl-CoA synthetase-like protein [Glonium stellatum]
MAARKRELTEQEMAEIWRWNGNVPPSIAKCMHDLVAERVKQCPTSPAVCAWDGQLTYEELELLSTQLAHKLSVLQVGVGSIVPLCFEKSMWTVVAVLAVMKTGGAFVLMDPSQPEARLQAIVGQVRARTILTSKLQSGLGFRIAPGSKLVAVGQEYFLSGNEPISSNFSPVPPSATLYVIFTSGSTGKPKGVVISHENYTSGALPRSLAVGYEATSRVLDFASYAFDVSIDCMLCTLIHGGCICVPSDEERVNDLGGAILRMKVNMAHMTPSVARILDPGILSSLKILGLGGESVSAGDASSWSQLTKVVIAYGPSECTVGCTINNDIALGRQYTSIGKGVGGITWIADPTDHDYLVPIGAVGELLVEGPIVGQGYLGDPEKTSMVFIESPAWLLEGIQSCSGRRGRLYKTGDLVKYDPDGSGSIIFVGRKDSQVKLRGQRVELGEVEYHLRAQLPEGVNAVAEVITPNGEGREPMLVAFISMQSPDGKRTLMGELGVGAETLLWSVEMRAMFAGVNKAVAKVLPRYMVPSAYIPVASLPMMVSGKTDRKRLRELGFTMTQQQLAMLRAKDTENNRPKTVMECNLQNIWSRLLNNDKIDVNDNFFSLGGDSITAMKLVTAARTEGLSLTVADVLSYPTLSEMALAANSADTAQEDEVPAFSLLASGWETDAARAEAGQLCDLDPTFVEDIYPCTPLQEGLMALSSKFSDAYVAQRVLELLDFSTIYQFQAAWEAVVTQSPILRTRIIQTANHGLMQVVIKCSIEWASSSNLEDYLIRDRESPMGLGKPLARYAIINDAQTGKMHFAWTIHHALYDGWSTPLIIERVNRAYRGLEIIRSPVRFKTFIRYLCDIDYEASKTFWRIQLREAIGPQYPPWPSRSYTPRADALLERYVTVDRHKASGTTLATVIRGAWALIASRLSGSDDVVFGETLTGRAAPIQNIEQIEGPMITTVPVRVQVDRSASVQNYLQTIQNQGIRRIAHEHLGLQHIRRVSLDAREACNLKMGLVIQPTSQADDKIEQGPASGLVPAGDTEAAREALKFNTYALMLVCTLDPNGFLIMASFDSNTVAVTQMERVLAQLDLAVQQLCEKQSSCLSQLECLTEQDREEIWHWNRIPPALVDSDTQNLIIDRSCGFSVGRNYPSIVVPWIVDPLNYESLAPIGAVGELFIEGPISSANFIENPCWLLVGDGKNDVGRRGRLSKTGDLVRYGADGTILFMARKDAQASLQGRQIDIPFEKSFQTKTLKEQKLCRLWSRVLGIDEARIQAHDSFFNLGGDSIMAMRLVSAVRLEGFTLKVSDVFRHQGLSDMADVLEDPQLSENVFKIYAAFSAVNVQDIDTFLLEEVRPTLADPKWTIKDVLPTTLLQEGAVKASVSSPRFSMQYNLLHLDKSIDRTRLFRSCKDLVSHHEILRTTFIENSGYYFQVILDDVVIPIIQHKADSDIKTFTQRLCAADAEENISMGSLFLKFIFIEGKASQNCLIIRISHAQYDGMSLPGLLLQLRDLYIGKALPRPAPFSAYIYHMLNETVPSSYIYWQSLLAGSTMTVIRPASPTPKSPKAIAVSKKLDISHHSKDHTISTLVTAAWSLVLSRFSSTQDVVFGQVVAGRSIVLPGYDIEQIQGPCDQHVPVRIKFNPNWTGVDLLKYVQDQRVTTSSFESTGLKEIMKNCVSWPPETEFDSVVHHHDITYFDTIEFAGTECRVEALNPHAEPAQEWKVQSFSRGNDLYIEIVGSDSWMDLSASLLDSLCGAAMSLVREPDAKLF